MVTSIFTSNSAPPASGRIRQFSRRDLPCLPHSAMATVLIHPKYRTEFSPVILNLLHLKTFTDDQGVEVVFMRRRNNGDILMKTAAIPEPDFFGETLINEVPVDISLPGDLNYIKGVIFHEELAYLQPKDLLELLKTQVDQIKKVPRAAWAELYWLKTKRTELPPTVLLGWDQVRVKPTQPRPLRCCRCQTYGHLAADCKNAPVCGYCAGDHETSSDCQNADKCASCGGPHQVFDLTCPVWVEEQEVAKIKHREKTSYRDAFKRRKEDKTQEQADKTEKTPQEDKPEETLQEDKTEETHQEDKTEETLQEDKTEETHQEAPRTKRKINREEEDLQDDQQGATSQAKSSSGLKNSTGEWRQVTSRKKKKDFSLTKTSS